MKKIYVFPRGPYRFAVPIIVAGYRTSADCDPLLLLLLLLVVTWAVAVVESWGVAVGSWVLVVGSWGAAKGAAASKSSFHGSRDVFIKLSQPTLALPTFRALCITCSWTDSISSELSQIIAANVVFRISDSWSVPHATHTRTHTLYINILHYVNVCPFTSVEYDITYDGAYWLETKIYKTTTSQHNVHIIVILLCTYFIAACDMGLRCGRASRWCIWHTSG